MEVDSVEAVQQDKSTEPSWRISWENMRSEISGANITWGHFFAALFISFLPSLLDFGTDYLSGVNFLRGTNYTKYVGQGSDFGNCYHVGRYTSFVSSKPEILYEEILCFEVDKIWGLVTIGITFLPGFRFASWTRAEAIRQKRPRLGYCLLALMLPLGPLFPLFVLLLKGFGLFCAGREFKKLIQAVTSMEGTWEATLQFLLNLFIVFSRADRSPSWVQLASLATSLVLIVKTAIADFLRGRLPPNTTLAGELRRTLPLLPLFLSNTFFKLGSIAVVASLLRYWALLIYPGLPFFILFTTQLCPKSCRLRSNGGIFHAMLGLNLVQRVTKRNFKEMRLLTENQTMANFLFHNILWFITNTCILSSLVVANHLKLFHFGTSQVIFEEDPKLLNVIFALILISGMISAVLLYVQVWTPYKEKQNSKRTTTPSGNNLKHTEEEVEEMI